MLSCKVNPKLRFLAKWHKGQPILDMTCTGSKPHTHQLAQEARVSIATRARERGGLNRNEGERKELVLVVSQTRQDIASRAYVSHLNMRIRVAVVRLRRDKGSRLQLGQEKGKVSIATRARERIATRAKANKD